MPKVSVIILTRNRAHLVQRAIESALAQTFQDFEIIVVDDASEDDTAAVVMGISDPRVHYRKNQSNLGEARSRNAGIACARGEYIAFLDDDDTWLPEKLAAQVSLLDTLPAKVGAVYTSYIRVDVATGATGATVRAEKRGNLSSELCEQNWVGLSTILVRRECFDKVGGFDEELGFGTDYDMWIRIGRDYEFEAISRPLVRYAVHSTQMSGNTRTILRGKEHQLHKYRDYFAVNRRSYGRYLLSLGVLYCYNGEAGRGRAILLRALRAYPFEPRIYANLLLACFGAETFVYVKSLKERLQRSLSTAA